MRAEATWHTTTGTTAEMPGADAEVGYREDVSQVGRAMVITPEVGQMAIAMVLESCGMTVIGVEAHMGGSGHDQKGRDETHAGGHAQRRE